MPDKNQSWNCWLQKRGKRVKREPIPGEYETDFVGDSGNREQTNLSAFGMKGLDPEAIVLIN